MPNAIPIFDFASRATITRKTLERLACFSKLQSDSSESKPLLDRTLAKINGFVKHLDSSILTAELCYEFASAAMIACDKEHKEFVGTTMEDLSSLASKGSDTAQAVATGFKEVEQAIYKIAASTKDSMLVVQIPPDLTQTKTVHKQLKDVGTDLVANLKLFSQFSRAAEEIAEWWTCVKNELLSDTPALPHISTAGDTDEQSVLWSNMKENLWEYYTIVNVAQHRFPDLLGPSIAAWQSAASARNVSDAKIPSGEGAQPQRSTSKSLGRLLSRFYESKKRTGDAKVKARAGNQGSETGISENDPGKGASRSSDSLPAHPRLGKIQTLFTACISAGPISKCF